MKRALPHGQGRESGHHRDRTVRRAPSGGPGAFCPAGKPTEAETVTRTISELQARCADAEICQKMPEVRMARNVLAEERKCRTIAHPFSLVESCQNKCNFAAAAQFRFTWHFLSLA